jgi:hypothetical protein
MLDARPHPGLDVDWFSYIRKPLGYICAVLSAIFIMCACYYCGQLGP